MGQKWYGRRDHDVQHEGVGASVVACGDAASIFELCQCVLDAMALAI